MTQTPEQQYGIYHFLEKADEVPSLKDSIYYQLESGEMAKGNYLGSPALAMNVLGKQAKRFVFFDLEKSALENVGTYAKQIELKCLCRDTSCRLFERYHRATAFTSHILFHPYRSLRNRQERRFWSNLSRCPDTGYPIRNEVFIMVWIHDRR